MIALEAGGARMAGFALASALLATWSDIDEPGSFISRRVRLVLTLLVGGLLALVGWSAAAAGTSDGGEGTSDGGEGDPSDGPRPPSGGRGRPRRKAAEQAAEQTAEASTT
jgi:hypothetical protein